MARGEYFDLFGDNHRGIVSNFRQPVEKFPNFMKNTTVKIGPKHEKMPKYGIFMVEKFLTIVEYFLIFYKIFTPARQQTEIEIHCPGIQMSAAIVVVWSLDLNLLTCVSCYCMQLWNF